MPTYDYICEQCGYEFEAFHSMFTGNLRKCPECLKHSLIKLISGGAAVIIRGTSNPCRGEIQVKTKKKKLEKLGSKKGPTPSWRSRTDGKIRKDILKDIKKYIETGEV